jgi:hypothetical protein
MDLLIRPHEGIGPIRFGMDSNAVRNILGGTVRSFRKTADAKAPTDAFDEYGMHVYYDDAGRCEAVEVASPGTPILHGQPLIGRPFEELRHMLEQIDPKAEVDDAGLTAPSLGIGVFAPFASDSPGEPVEGVIVFKEGYYNHP